MAFCAHADAGAVASAEHTAIARTNELARQVGLTCSRRARQNADPSPNVSSHSCDVDGPSIKSRERKARELFGERIDQVPEDRYGDLFTQLDATHRIAAPVDAREAATQRDVERQL